MSEPVMSIVVGVDFEASGDHALREGIRLTRSMEGCELHPVHVLSKGGPGRRVDALSSRIERASEALRERTVYAARLLFGDDGWDQQVVLHVRVGEPAPALHQLAVDVDARLLVVGHQPREGLDRLILGSVARELVHSARLPILVARPNEVAELPKTRRPEPARAGEDLRAERGFSRSERVRFGARPSHVSGLL